MPIEDLKNLIFDSYHGIDKKTIILRVDYANQAELLFENRGQVTEILTEWANKANVDAECWGIQKPKIEYCFHAPHLSLAPTFKY